MRVTSPVALLCHISECPGLLRRAPARLCPAPVTVGDGDELRLRVAIDVRKGSRLIVDDAEDDVLCPVTLGALVVLVPDRFRATRQAKRENVEPAVLIEIVDEDRVAVGITGDIERHRSRLPERPLLCVIWPWVPMRSGDDVSLSVAIQIPVVDTFRVELGGQSSLDEVGRTTRRTAHRREGPARAR